MAKYGSTSFKDTNFGILPREKLVKLEEKGVKKGLDYISSLNQNVIKTTDIDIPLILKLHKISYAWIFPKWAGKFRTIDVAYSGKEAIEYFKVREAITNLCLDLKVRMNHLSSKNNSKYITNVIELVSWFQHRFVQIHPFNDYNGRTARMLTSFLLLKFDLPAIEIKADNKSDRKKYIRAMQEADEGNYSNLEKLIASALEEGLQKFDLKLKT
ncbi:hypothetical protein A2130_00595 [Candidatus Woesebacteria bacterium GWC2_33_12]|uniref:CRISPR-associated helicase Cas3 n=1 Tax=Candidatus Woesebacteria bacterium GW2011_GWB1_33_22 TaxID=1618566 RepID=A0A0G0CPC6_9BACT|nr:MAG: CRISPR-associated helicase Cas3 [Candidatus Woesebacteria bacterium GW2011_GWC2_33_12]KKP42484.1 MAG: CRISPR-associated helicase Cas3 [Candidatus Woesebacteria bacterium GW2011_GWA2_33_20]KKP45227.1 MAG: CRISPR-associated helicase Cas3 [Candidatus Woesebacteria bacterium GW2011_GWB1_33_22]KKP46478.1 MAG: Helicase-like protein [Microgenomates group bacterium GW2011_GWC1_33_28]KKP50897.1 MAG: CRISPR-associated helicase Cas3 [Candidatus Woesebacteria bacterium GW2011_GWA1_33_33]OGM07119.1